MLRTARSVAVAIVVAVLAATVALTLAYQARPAYTIAMQDPFDHVYLTSGFYDAEHDARGDFRWMSGEGVVLVQGAGRQPFNLVLRMGTDAQDPRHDKPVEVRVRGALVAVFTAHDRQETFQAPIDEGLVSRSSGDLQLQITAPTFQPQGDGRDLAVAVSLVKIEPAGSPGLILPPFFHLLYVTAIALLVMLLAALLGAGRYVRLAAGLGAVLVIALFYAFARPFIAVYTESLLLALFLVAVALAIARPVVRWAYRRALPGFDPAGREARFLFALFTVGLFVSCAGLVYPQSGPNDFMFHLHRFEDVQRGNIFFDNYGYVVSGIGSAFYAPAMYFFFLPFAFIFRNAYFPVLLLPALLDFSMVFVIFYLARRYFPSHSLVAPLAAALYCILPINLLVIWWAHEANVFGLVLLLASTVYLLEQYDNMTRWPVWLGFTALLFVLLLSHPGVLVWSIALFVPLLTTFLLIRRVKKRGSYRSVFAAGGALMVAGVLAFGLYYSHYVDTFGQAADTGDGQQSQLSGTLSDLGDPGLLAPRISLTFRHGILSDYTVWPLVLAPLGIALAFGRRTRRPAPEDSSTSANLYDTHSRTNPQMERFRWTLVIWSAVGLGFLLLTLLSSFPIRPMLLLWPVVSIMAAVPLAVFIERSRRRAKRGGPRGLTLPWHWAAVGLLLGATAGISLYFWLQANFLAQRLPHIYPHVF